MNWKTIQFNWNHLRAFLVTAEEGTLSAAARALNVSQPTLGRQVSALEQEIGIALFERIGTRLSLTAAGQELADHARAMAAEATRFALAASGRSQRIEGTVCISAAELISAYLLPPLIERLARAESSLEIELVATNESSDLKRREADIALRANHASQPDLTSCRVCTFSSSLYASSDYLAQAGRPIKPTDMSQHRFIGFDDAGTYMQFLNALGLDLSKDNFPLRTESHLVQWAMARRGLGIVTALDCVAERHAEMERVLPDLPAIITPMHLVAHRDVLRSRRVGFVYEFLKEELASL